MAGVVSGGWVSTVAALKCESSMARTAAAVLGVAVVGAGAYLFATPYISLNQFREAIEARDLPAIERHVDFPKLRSSLKEQLKSRLSEEITRQAGGNQLLNFGMGAIGYAIAEPMINAAVDTYVSPAGLKEMLAGSQPATTISPSPGNSTASNSTASNSTASNSTASNTTASNTTVSSGYKTPNLFVVSARDASSGQTVRFNFERQELVLWKLTSVSLP